ncbi:MAM and LDL-receptor class A domain-containing protein [Caerostris extrusa]|uniref:MAM and LDL-receptor class A domain-containing protein n=1 Tax=Caerostris extrusa TaxID=172846 RepID=A0AAV4XSF2_CAEEX|nr:MAM and LDL-receptor class A domain-containing protein [Caerostris extrusa]
MKLMKNSLVLPGGACQDALVNMCKSYVRPSFDYGSELLIITTLNLCDVKFSVLPKLDVTQNYALHLITDAAKSTAIESMELQTNIKPLSDSRDKSALFLRKKLLRRVGFYWNNYKPVTKKRLKTPTLFDRAGEIYEELNLPIIDRQPLTDSYSATHLKGQMLYYSADTSGPQTLLKVVSPVFEPNTLPTCAIQFALHMFRMDFSTFKMVIKAPNSTWESTAFEGNSAHRWENQTQPINVVTQPFQVILEIINPSSGYPSHVAIDNVKPINCYHKPRTTTDCTPRQFQCDDMICVDPNQVCNLHADCADAEDEDQDCDKIAESAFCTFERDLEH